jgi:hypothetical protein
MSLFDKLNGQQPQMNMQQLQSDPIGAAQKAGYNIPPNLAGNPQAMVQHLIQSGQVGGQKLQQAMQMMQRLGIK